MARPMKNPLAATAKQQVKMALALVASAVNANDKALTNSRFLVLNKTMDFRADVEAHLTREDADGMNLETYSALAEAGKALVARAIEMNGILLNQQAADEARKTIAKLDANLEDA